MQQSWRFIHSSAGCSSCRHEFQVRYRLDFAEASPAAPYATTARRCPKCDKYFDIPIMAGGYYVEIDLPAEIVMEREVRAAVGELAAQQARRDREAQAEARRKEERLRGLCQVLGDSDDLLPSKILRLDAEIAKAEAALGRVGDADPVSETGVDLDLCDLRDDLRWLIEVRDSLLKRMAIQPQGGQPGT
jgi:hypothetical protein